MMHSRSRAALAVAQAVAYLAVAGCGGSGAPNDAQAPLSEGQGRVHSLATSASPASPNGSTISRWSGGYLIDGAGNTWRLNGSGTSVGPGVTLNGVYCGQGAELLTIVDGLIWAQHTAGDWYTLVAPGIGTPQASGPPAPAPAPAPAPSYSATVSWTAPVQNTNGTPLTDVAGYVISYGTSPTSLAQSIVVSDPGLTTGTVTGLPAGTYYFSVATRNSTGASSTASGVVSRTVP